MRTERELRALCRRIDALELDTREIILAYAVGPGLVDTASGVFSRDVHASCPPAAAPLQVPCLLFAMDYSRRCVDAARRIILHHSREETPGPPAIAPLDHRHGTLADYPSATVDTLIFVRLGRGRHHRAPGAVVGRRDTVPGCGGRYRFEQSDNSIFVRPRRIEFLVAESLFDDVPAVSLRPTRDTVVPWTRSILSRAQFLCRSNPLFDGYLVPRLLLSYEDWRHTGRHRQPGVPVQRVRVGVWTLRRGVCAPKRVVCVCVPREVCHSPCTHHRGPRVGDETHASHVCARERGARVDGEKSASGTVRSSTLGVAADLIHLCAHDGFHLDGFVFAYVVATQM